MVEQGGGAPPDPTSRRWSASSTTTTRSCARCAASWTRPASAWRPSRRRRQFLESEHRGRADCLVLDVHLGGLSGLDLQERLATSGVSTPIVIITAHDERVHARAGPAGRRDRVPAEALRRRLADRRHPQGDRPLLTRAARSAPRRGDPGTDAARPALPGRRASGLRPALLRALAAAPSCSPAAASCRRVCHPYLGGPTFPPTDPAQVAILRSEPSRPHERLGEVFAEPSGDPTAAQYEQALREGRRQDGRRRRRGRLRPACRSSDHGVRAMVGALGRPDRRARGGGPRDPLLGPLTRAVCAPTGPTRAGQGHHERAAGRRRRAEPVHGPRRRAPRLDGATAIRRAASIAAPTRPTASAGSAARRSSGTSAAWRPRSSPARPWTPGTGCARSDPHELLAHAARVLRAPVADAATLVERLGRPLWIDFVSDTGDDRDVSAAVARLVFAEYAPADGRRRHDPAARRHPPLRRRHRLSRGDGPRDPAPAGPALERGAAGGRNRRPPARPPGHPGKPRLVRRAGRIRPALPPGRGGRDARALGGGPTRTPRASGRPGTGAAPAWSGSSTSTSWRDPSTSSGRRTSRSARSSAGERDHRVARLVLRGYTPVQEASHLALPLAPGLDLWGVDRQLRRLDFRQRTFFIERRAEQPGRAAGVPGPRPGAGLRGAEPGRARAMLAACRLTLERDRVLYLSGDFHHYERRAVGESLHVIAGGGGAFLHGTRIPPSPRGPADTRLPGRGHQPEARARAPVEADGRHGRLPPAHALRAARRDPAPGPRARARGRDA